VRLSAAAAVLVAVVAVAAGCGGSSSDLPEGTVDTELCPFPLVVTVTSKTAEDVGTNVLRFEFGGPLRIVLRNATTGRSAELDSSGSHAVDTRTGSVTFRGHQVWYWAGEKQVPFLATDGTGTLTAPTFVLEPGSSRARVVDPCARVAPAKPSTKPRTTRAPWGLPAYALSQIEYAGLTPLLGRLVRHDHVHLDIAVDGRKVRVPAGIGLAEPVDGGPCPAGAEPQGDCVTRHIYAAAVANSPLHTHSSSGLIHVEPDRPGTFTLGQFFDEWGVRLDSRCIGGYCAGGGKELRAYVDGRRVAGDPRRIELGNRQEIALVYGGPGDFSELPAYRGGWPGGGCGGKGEPSC
jgi:hypothetical protein